MTKQSFIKICINICEVLIKNSRNKFVREYVSFGDCFQNLGIILSILYK